MKFKIEVPWRDYQGTSIKKILESGEGSIHVIKSPRQC